MSTTSPSEAPGVPAGHSTPVKVCGITQLGDAELAADLGAWAVGMIFYEGSPRSCSLEQAQMIVARLRRRVLLCGVFVNEPLDRVLQLGDELGLDMLQLHGDEGPAYCAEVARRTGARVIKATQVSGPGEIREIERFHVDFHLLDARSRSPKRAGLRGGTGESFDWALLGGRRSTVPLILSGGLGPANVAQAIAQVRPYAVDTASGTEAAPGHKDPQKLRDFIAAAGGPGPGGEARTTGGVEARPTGDGEARPTGDGEARPTGGGEQPVEIATIGQPA
jgi:phosphoribosylanthranilate isomerase